MSRQNNVLVIDDDPMIRQLVEVRLKRLNAAVTGAANGPEGIELARKQPPDLILLDIAMPEMDGFEVCRQLRDNPITGELPIIFLTGSEGPDEKIRGFELGATDYITKPFDAGELLARVRNTLRLQALVEALERQARTDSLTGLPNRAAFHHALTRCVERGKRVPGYHFAVLFIDLDRFKVINDSLGHVIGDELLMTVAERIRHCVRGGTSPSSAARGDHVVARMGGDEFAVLLDDIACLEDAEGVARRLHESLDHAYEMQGYHVKVGISVGIRFSEGEADNADTLLRDSDIAMYHAKAAGRGRFMIFDRAMHEQAVYRLEMEAKLCRAMDRNEFRIAYQPILDAESGRVAGFESLLRWHPNGEANPITPDKFIPIAEETGLIVELGQWMLEQVGQLIQQWRRNHPDHPHLWCSVNVSKVQCERDGLKQTIVDMLTRHNLQPSALKLEITESAIMHDMARIIPVLDDLRTYGLEVAMDDFGTGYSSLASLHRFPIDILKIDRSFIQNITTCRTYSAIVDAIAMLAHNLDMRVVAEGIETTDQLVQIQALECDYAQGFLLSKPMPAEAIEDWLNDADPAYVFDTPDLKRTR